MYKFLKTNNSVLFHSNLSQGIYEQNASYPSLQGQIITIINSSESTESDTLFCLLSIALALKTKTNPIRWPKTLQRDFAWLKS